MILNFKKTFTQNTYFSVDLMGKNLKLNINYSRVDSPEVDEFDNEINITLPARYKHCDNINIINLCIQKLYNEVAIAELEYAMEFSRHIFKFAPEEFRIKRMENDYCKYVNKTLTINPDIVQFNEQVIFSTVIKAFCKMKYRQGSKKYFELLEYGLKEYEKYNGNESNMELWQKIS